MVRSAVSVVLRTRPSTSFASSNIQIQDGDKKLQLFLNRQDAMMRSQQEYYEFKFDGILHEASQEETFAVCGADIVDGTIKGYNGTILAYGQTGAGKTYTMTGKGSTFQQRGITPRAVAEVFKRLREQSRFLATVRVSYVEIYNENFFDLLRPATDSSSISVTEDANGSVILKGAECRVVASEADALSALFEGETSRAIAQHQMNKESSRSHACFTIYVESRPSPDSDEIVASKLHMVDLAGSERVAKTGSTGQVLKEATHINKSLAFLEQVIVALSEKSRSHVPYRSSKLTHLLKGSLGGNCKTLMIANIWGEFAHLGETLSTCRFAQRMSRVSNDLVLNVKPDSTQAIKKYERIIQDLKDELSMHDDFVNRSGVTYEPYNAEQRQKLRGMVLQYFSSADPDHSVAPLEPLLSVRHVKEILIQCKALHREYAAGRAPVPESRPVASSSVAAGSLSRTPSNNGASSHNQWQQPQETDGGAEFVGDLEEDPRTMGIPAAPDDIAAAQPMAFEPPPVRSGTAGSAAPMGLGGAHPAPPKAASRQPPASNEEALAEFKAGPGMDLSDAMVENKCSLRAAKQRQKEIALRINAMKKEIDQLKDAAEAARGLEGGALDDETYSSVLRLKEIKSNYREEYQELQMVKSEIEYTTKLLDSCTKELSAAFEEWYLREFGAPQDSASAAAESIHPRSSGHGSSTSTTRPASNSSSASMTTGNSPGSNALPKSGSGAPGRLKSSGGTASPMADAPSDSSPEARAFFSAQQHATVHNTQHQPTARNRPVGTFGSGPKMVAGNTSAHDIDRGSRR